MRRGRRARRLPGIIGSIQAIETIKSLLVLGDPLIGRLLAYDAPEESFRTFQVACSGLPGLWPGRGEIVIAEYDELCMPHRLCSRRQASPRRRTWVTVSL